MLNSEQSERYSRHIRLRDFGESAQQDLLGSSVLVIGAGGLGCPVLQYLAAAGVGKIGIADDDIVSLSNLHRQVLYTSADTGKSKTDVAAAKLQAMNPDVTVDRHPVRVNASNARGLISGYDVIVDTTDNIPARYHINDACLLENKPLVYGAIFRWEGQVTVFNYKGGPTYRCLYPEPPGSMVLSCDQEGVIGALPGLIGTYQAVEVIKIITGKGNVLSGRMLCLDISDHRHYFVKFTRQEDALQKSQAVKRSSELDTSQFAGLLEAQVQVLDVRTREEFARQNAGGLNIPLDKLKEHLNTLQSYDQLIVVCQTGRRSPEAIRILQESGWSGTLHNLTKGLSPYFN